MPGPIAARDIVAACNQGIKNAHELYVQMSGGDWLWNAPEYFLTTHIAIEIHKQPGTKRVICEHGTRKALIDAGALGKGKLHPDIRQNGRVDILIRRANGTPRGVIEVKNRVFNRSQYEGDMKRIGHILKRKSSDSSLDFGIFSFYTVTSDSSRGSAEQNSELRRDTIENNMANILGNDFRLNMSHISFDVGDGWAAHAMSALIKLV